MIFYTGKLFPAWQNSLFIGGLGSTNLVRLSVKGDQVVGEERLLRHGRGVSRDGTRLPARRRDQGLGAAVQRAIRARGAR